MGFDDANINWRKLGDFEHFTYTVFAIDEDNEIADFALKFEPEERIFLHRHKAETATFVLEGEHRIYEPAGDLRETRGTGTFTVSPADPAPHQEGGGSEGAVVLYSTRGSTEGIVFDVLNDAGQTVGTLSFADLNALFDVQDRVGGA